jgi:hypothetical protein
VQLNRAVERYFGIFGAAPISRSRRIVGDAPILRGLPHLPRRAADVRLATRRGR